MPSTTIKWFTTDHLSLRLLKIANPIKDLAEKMEAILPDGPEKSAGMRKLLEAKDCFIRAQVEAIQNGEKPTDMA